MVEEMTNGYTVLVCPRESIGFDCLDGRWLRQLGIQKNLEFLILEALLRHQLFGFLDAFFLHTLVLSGLIPNDNPLIILTGHGLTEISFQDFLVCLNLHFALGLICTERRNGL